MDSPRERTSRKSAVFADFRTVSEWLRACFPTNSTLDQRLPRDGMTSHGAVVSRGIGIPAIGDERFNVDSNNQVAYALGHEIREGDYISICAQAENGWGLGDCIIPNFKMQTDNGSYSYLVAILHEYDDVSLFSRCDMDFQLHYARIKEALHRLGI